MNSLDMNIAEREDRMPFVRFERVPVDDPAATLAAGHYVAKDVDMVNVTPPYSKDIMKYKVSNWLEQLKTDMQNGRIPAQWVTHYHKQYDAWLNGQELPLDGIPIKGWGVISPAQQETLIKMHVLTVEQLAVITDEGIRRIGMGGIDLKNKANAWLDNLKKSGRSTIEIATLKKENHQLQMSVESLEKQVKALSALVESEPKHKRSYNRKQESAEISADDILE